MFRRRLGGTSKLTNRRGARPNRRVVAMDLIGAPRRAAKSAMICRQTAARRHGAPTGRSDGIPDHGDTLDVAAPAVIAARTAETSAHVVRRGPSPPERPAGLYSGRPLRPSWLSREVPPSRSGGTRADWLEHAWGVVDCGTHQAQECEAAKGLRRGGHDGPVPWPRGPDLPTGPGHPLQGARSPLSAPTLMTRRAGGCGRSRMAGRSARYMCRPSFWGLMGPRAHLPPGDSIGPRGRFALSAL